MWTKLLENSLLAKYLISVAAALIASGSKIESFWEADNGLFYYLLTLEWCCQIFSLFCWHLNFQFPWLVISIEKLSSFSDLLCWFVSKSSSENSSSPDRLLPVAKYVPALPLTELLSVQDGFLLLLENNHKSLFNKSKFSNTILQLPLLVSLKRAVENVYLMSLTFSKMRLYPIFIRPSLALTLSFCSFHSCIVNFS